MAGVDLITGRLGFQQLAQTGRGPARDVVMIHGLGANFGFWYASAVQWFRRFGRVTLLDLPGHGTSAMPASGYAPSHLAEVLGDFFDHLGIERAHLVAHSFGGSVALAFALARPERTLSLVLADVRLWAVEPPTAPDSSTPWLQKLRGSGLTLDEGARDPSVQILVELAQQRLERDDPDVLISEALPGARSLFPGKRAAKKWLQLIETTSAYAEMIDPAGLALADVARLDLPILAVYGGHSNRKRSALALHRACPHARLHVIPEVGHFFPLTRPRLFARPALAFLRATERDKTFGRRRRLHPLRSEEVEAAAADVEAGRQSVLSLFVERGDDGPAALLVEEPLPLNAAKRATATDDVPPVQGIARPHIVH